MCQELDRTDWESLLCNESIDVNWDSFKKKLTTDKYVPNVVRKPPSNKPLWWTGTIAKANKQKHQLYSTFQSRKLVNL